MLISPLVGKDSPLDEHSQNLLSELIQANSERVRTLPTDHPRDEKRFARVELTSKEMWKQTEAIRSTLESEKQAIIDTARGISRRPVNRVYLVGCGDSLFSMIGVRGFLEKILGVSCEPMQALDFAYYYAGLVDDKSVVITLSSTGKTPRTMEALLVAKNQGAQTISLTNTIGTPLMTEADYGLYIHAERKGWPTQSSTAAMGMLYQLGMEIGKIKGVASTVIDGYEKELNRTIDLIIPTLEANDLQITTIAKEEARKGVYLFSGGGPAYVCALFGAAKTKELTPSHALAIALEEYHHYRSQKSGDPLFLIAPRGPSTIRAKDTGCKGLDLGGSVYAVVTEGDPTLEGCYSKRIDLPEVDEFFTPILYTLPLQQFAYGVAKEKYRLEGME